MLGRAMDGPVQDRGGEVTAGLLLPVKALPLIRAAPERVVAPKDVRAEAAEVPGPRARRSTP